ncbi:hypothetical protein [Paraburkholderia humisilvae]|uniref:Uncharacterized protein n=1 Tax=Paraburkholderia humisilvae TaxID=627669 RepID=A0A6J5DKT2_9BURK|nr:hypothetical protein [Paraburkholderia humisilvae]CAB3754900.1 hypothetical protein LMG29542_02483 [Paraburkholderia humisilvae]
MTKQTNTGSTPSVPSLKAYLIALVLIVAGIMVFHEGPLRPMASFSKFVLGI